MRAYFATKLSPNMSKTPNGFLICKNVPIARTGEQEYLGSELGLEDERKDQLVNVIREEREVFSPETLASFEGVIFTDDHPSAEEVNTQNVQYLQRGFVKDIRRGEGNDADKIVADIIVTDPVTIGEIVDDGKREISCGYKCTYEEVDGKIYQREIRGNHVALVDSGRAGKDVAIKDSSHAVESRKESFFMKRKDKRKSIFSKLMGVVAHDADPEVVGELVEEIVSNSEGSADEEPAPEKKEEPTPAPAPEPTKEEPTKDDDISQRFDKLEALLQQLIAGKSADEDPLEKLESEVEGGSEESAEKPVDEMDEGEETTDEGEQTADEDGAALDEAEETADEECNDEEATGEEAPKSTSDKAAVKKAISDAKKVVAGIKDAKQRKIVSDSMAKLIRQSYGIKATTPKTSYSAINAVKRKAQRAADSKQTIDIEARQKAYDARNPHLNKNK